MNRTDRLLAIVLEIQGRRWARAEDLAATFEVSKRTIYRDIMALGQAGVPLMAVPGRGYALVEGYFLPPLNFSADEAAALLLGSAFVARTFDAQYRQAAQRAARKIAGVLPAPVRAQVDDLQERLKLIGLDAAQRPEQAERLRLLRQSILDCRRVRFGYHTRSAPEGADPRTVREADPYGLLYMERAWYVTAYCHLRQAVRHFRLDRMRDLVLLDATFTRPADFTMCRQDDLDHPMRITVRVLFTPDVAPWVREAPSFYQTAAEETQEGLLVTLRVRHERDVVQWLLGWGRHVRILEPASLRRRLAEEARAMLCNFTEA